MTFDPREIGKRLRAGREKKKWTQFDAASNANVSMSTIARWESGGLPPIRELERYASLLEVSVADVVEPPDPEASAPLAALVARLELVASRLEAAAQVSAQGGKPRRRVP